MMPKNVTLTPALKGPIVKLLPTPSCAAKPNSRMLSYWPWNVFGLVAELRLAT